MLLDNLGGARAAVEHLLARGHERIAVVADPDDLYTAAERLAGYRQALDAAGVPVREELLRLGTHDAAQAEAVVRELLALPADRRPTAVFAGNNRHTIGALRAMQRPPPRRSRWSGSMTSSSRTCSASPSSGTTASQMGAHAAALAFERLDGGARAPRRVIVPTELVVRGSGEVPPS